MYAAASTRSHDDVFWAEGADPDQFGDRDAVEDAVLGVRRAMCSLCDMWTSRCALSRGLCGGVVRFSPARQNTGPSPCFTDTSLGSIHTDKSCGHKHRASLGSIPACSRASWINLSECPPHAMCRYPDPNSGCCGCQCPSNRVFSCNARKSSNFDTASPSMRSRRCEQMYFVAIEISLPAIGMAAFPPSSILLR